MAPSPPPAPHPACLHRVQRATLLHAWGCCLVTKSHYQLHLMTPLLLQYCLRRGRCSSCLRACPEMVMGLRCSLLYELAFFVPFDGSGGRCHICKELVLIKRSLLPQF